MPLWYSRKSLEIGSLELFGCGGGDFCVSSHGRGKASVIASMAEFLCHIPVGEVSVERCVSDLAIAFRIRAPSEGRPSCLCNKGMEITTITGVKVRPVIANDARKPSNFTAFSLFQIDPANLPAGICDEHCAERCGDVL